VGVESDQWERGKPLPPMPNMPQYDGRRGGPPPGMRGGPGGPMGQLHKTDSAYKVGATLTDDPAEEQAQKRLKSLLNKITKDNFGKIVPQVRGEGWGSRLVGCGGNRGSWKCKCLLLGEAQPHSSCAIQPLPGCPAFSSLITPPLALLSLQIAEVINERKLAITLSGFINQIFDKALTETHFAELYADLVAA
jgi:hypothetical protein